MANDKWDEDGYRNKRISPILFLMYVCKCLWEHAIEFTVSTQILSEIEINNMNETEMLCHLYYFEKSDDGITIKWIS